MPKTIAYSYKFIKFIRTNLQLKFTIPTEVVSCTDCNDCTHRTLFILSSNTIKFLNIRFYNNDMPTPHFHSFFLEERIFIYQKRKEEKGRIFFYLLIVLNKFQTKKAGIS